MNEKIIKSYLFKGYIENVVEMPAFVVHWLLKESIFS